MWTLRLDDIPEALNDLCVTIEGKAYSFDSYGDDDSGSDSDESSGYFSYAYTFDAATHRWNMLHTQSHPDDDPKNIHNRSIVAYGSCAYLWGGRYSSQGNSALYCFDTRALTWSRPQVSGQVPRPDVCHSACLIGQRMYIFGGLNDDSSHCVRFLDLESFEWHRVRTSGEAPARRNSHTASAIGSRMYIWGGVLHGSTHDDSYDNTLYYLETATATWVRPQVEGRAPEGRQNHCAFVYDNELYVFGGSNELLHTHYADLHKYDPQRSCWTPVTPLGSGPSARRSAGCTRLGERVLVFGGLQLMEDLTDLHVLHLAPTLKNLCLLAVIDAGLDVGSIKQSMRNEINRLTSPPS